MDLEKDNNQTPKNILYVWNYLEWGGAQIYFLAIMKRAVRDWNVKVILPRRSSLDILRFIEQSGVEYEFVDAELDGAPAPTLKRKLRRQWRRINAEIKTYRHLLRYPLSETVVHIEAAPWQSWVLLSALARRGAQVFVTTHNSLPKFAGGRELLWKSRMQFLSRLKNFHLFASNQDTKNSFKNWVAPEFWKRIEVTYTAVNPPEIDEVLNAEFDREALRRKHELPTDKFLVLCVGQFIDRKGRWVFLEAARQVLQKTRDVAFVWLSPKLPDDREREKIKEYDLEESFRLILSADVGKSRQDVLRFFRVADAFALPSFVEGLPIALLEAMALRLPSISTDVNAIPEAVIDRKTGLLIEAGDDAALAKAIQTLKNDQELRENLSKAGRDWVLKNFDERAVAEIAVKSYEESFRH